MHTRTYYTYVCRVTCCAGLWFHVIILLFDWFTGWGSIARWCPSNAHAVSFTRQFGTPAEPTILLSPLIQSCCYHYRDAISRSQVDSCGFGVAAAKIPSGTGCNPGDGCPQRAPAALPQIELQLQHRSVSEYGPDVLLFEHPLQLGWLCHMLPLDPVAAILATGISVVPQAAIPCEHAATRLVAGPLTSGNPARHRAAGGRSSCS